MVACVCLPLTGLTLPQVTLGCASEARSKLEAKRVFYFPAPLARAELKHS